MISPLKSTKNTFCLSLHLVALIGPPWLAPASLQFMPSPAHGLTEQYGPLTSVLWALWCSNKIPSTPVITGFQALWVCCVLRALRDK